jgi:hypothetical protein
MTATTEQVPIGAHWWRASGSILPAVLCDGFNQWKGGDEGFAQLPQRRRLYRYLRVNCGVSLVLFWSRGKYLAAGLGRTIVNEGRRGKT